MEKKRNWAGNYQYSTTNWHEPDSECLFESLYIQLDRVKMQSKIE